jgi:uncharacterized DUF497 family protein
MCIEELRFEWDDNKNVTNQAKHGVSFILLVVHCIRSESVIRIISSRKATTSEIKGYERSVSL